MVSENGTSTILHEVANIAGLHSAEKSADWVVEGLAEYLSVRTLLDAGGISQERYGKVIAGLEQWVARERAALKDPSTGADTAAAAVLFHQLQEELSRPGAFARVTLGLVQCQPISTQCLSRLAAGELGRPSSVLNSALQADAPR